MIQAVKRGQSAADNVSNLTFLYVQCPDHLPQLRLVQSEMI